MSEGDDEMTLKRWTMWLVFVAVTAVPGLAEGLSEEFRHSLLTPRQRWVVKTVTHHVLKHREATGGAAMPVTRESVASMAKTVHVHPDEIWLVADQMQRLADRDGVGGSVEAVPSCTR